MNHRLYRKTLKQKLFSIRRFVEGDSSVEMSDELSELKDWYENVPGFTSWSDFPEKWDVGDPHRVKEASFSFNDVDKRNFERSFNKEYTEIVFKEIKKTGE